MKEFSAQTGGRYTYSDDLENLQDLALAFSQIFDECDNFIVSGCEVKGNTVSAGYVFINNKIRLFAGSTGITSWPQYIYEVNSTESVPYDSGGAKIGRNNYSCAISKSVPTNQDTITGKTPQFIAIPETGGLRMKDAFLGKYALLLNPAVSSQSVDSMVHFLKTVYADHDLIANKKVVVKTGAVQTELAYEGSTFSIKYTNQAHVYILSWIDGVGLRCTINGTTIATISESAVEFAKPISASHAMLGGIVTTGNQIYQSTANTASEIQLNVNGYEGGVTQFRDTHIGNGKGKKILSVKGATGSIDLCGPTTVRTNMVNGLVLQASLLKDHANLVNAMAWSDSANVVMARMGFLDTKPKTFSIASSVYDMLITGQTAVDIGPAIKENGVLLEDKYAVQTQVQNALALKADLAQVYTTQQADDKFGQQGQGLQQFVSSSVSAEQCRTQIGAIGKSDLGGYVQKSKLLADMATDEEARAQIRHNIGAAAIGNFEPKMIDTGWVWLKDHLYIRRIGNIVCVQGNCYTNHSGVVFYIPNFIPAPTHSVKYSIAFSNNRNWVCEIKEGEHVCYVAYCNDSCKKHTSMALTYMI